MKIKGFSKDVKDGLSVVLDIGSGSVGGAFVIFSENEKPRIMFNVRKPIIFQKDFKFERFLFSMLKAIEEVLEELSKTKLGKPRQVFCILAAPWYVSETRSVVFEDEQAFTVTQKKVEDLILNEVNILKESFNVQYKDITDSKAEIIEVENINMKLNGYETNAPYGKKVKKIEAHLYISISAGQVLQEIRQKISKILGLNNVVFNSFSLSAFDTIRNLYSEQEDFMFVDIGGEMTDVSVVRDGILVETESFPFGKNFLLRMISSELKTVNDEALSSFSLYMEEKTTDANKIKIKAALSRVEEEWSEVLCKTLKSMSANVTLPGFIFTISDIPFGPWFSEVIKNKWSGKVLFMGETIKTTVINPLVLSKFVIFNPKVDKDAFIVTEVLFVDNLLKSKI